jgi:hypothetical protein
VVHELAAVAEEMSRWCDAHRAFEYAETSDTHSVLLRLAPPAHAEDIADQVYFLVVDEINPPEAVLVGHTVVDQRPAIEVTVTDASVDRDELRSVIEWIGAESERLIDLWHPHLPEDGA